MPPLPANPAGVEILAIAATGVVIDAVAIGLRLWARALKKRKFGAGDYLIVVAWFLAVADFGRKIQGYRWGVGLHRNQILATNPSHIHDAEKLTFAGYFVWSACVTCIKLSILFAYYELFYVIRWFTHCVWVTMTLCGVACLAYFVGLCTLCKPFERNYNPTFQGGRCRMTTMNSYILSGSINLTLDILLVVLPLPVVWTLRISRLKKVGVSAMFGLGLVIVVVVGLRFYYTKRSDPKDLTHGPELSSVELYLGMISACLPFIAPPIAKIWDTISHTHSFSILRSYNWRSGTWKSRSATKQSGSSFKTRDAVELHSREQSQEEFAKGYIV